MQRAQRARSAASRSARCSSRPAAATRSGFSGRDRGRVHDLRAGGDVGGGVADHRLDPVLAQPLGVGGLGAVGAGHLRAERTGAIRASPLMPAPPIPTKCRRREDQSLIWWRSAASCYARSSTTTGMSRLVLQLVIVVGGPAGGHLLPQLRFLLGCGRARMGGEAVVEHLHVDLGLLGEVQVPGRVLRSAAPGGHDEVVVAVAAVDQGRAALLAGSPAGGREDQDFGPVPFVTLLTVGCDVPLDVLLTEQHVTPPLCWELVVQTSEWQREKRPAYDYRGPPMPPPETGIPPAGDPGADALRTVELTTGGVAPEDVVAVARGDAPVVLGPGAREAMERSAAVVAALADSDEPAYGISTGFGSLARVRIPVERRAELQRALIRSHAAGMGPPVEREVVRAMMLLARPHAGDGLLGCAPDGGRGAAGPAQRRPRPRSCPSTARSAPAATSRRSRTARWC